MKQGNLAKEMQSMPNLKEMDNNSCRSCSTILFIPKSINLEISRRCQLSKRIQSFPSSCTNDIQMTGSVSANRRQKANKKFKPIVKGILSHTTAWMKV